jgi:hypothetical protein
MRRLVFVIILATSCSVSDDDPIEVARVRDHFSTVLAELRSADVSHLDASQLAARSVTLDRLRRYRDAGTFPHNHDAMEMIPYFIDRHGTRCAVAYLLEQSGESALVARVAAERNNAYVAELGDEPELLAWLERSGLSIAEAARIQVIYKNSSCDSTFLPCDKPWFDSNLITGALIGLDVVAVGVNARSDAGPPSGVFAAAAGGVSLLTGYQVLADTQDNTIGYLDLGLGLTTTALGVYNLVRDHGEAPRRSWSVAPSARTPGIVLAGTF